MSPRALTRAELSGWLRLAGASGVPAAACSALLGAFASLEALFAASHAELAALVGDAAAQSVLARRRPISSSASTRRSPGSTSPATRS